MLAALGRGAEAERDRRVAAPQAAAGFDALRELCAYLVRQGRSEEARAELDAAVARRPDVAAVYVERSRFRRRTRDLPGTLADLQAAAALTPSDAALLFEIGDVLYAGAQYEAAPAASPAGGRPTASSSPFAPRSATRTAPWRC